MPLDPNRVDGEDAGSILLFALSTCVWCKKTKRLLDSLGVAYAYYDTDKLTIKDLEEVSREHKRWNPRLSYPTLVVGDSEAIVGFDEEKIRKALGK